MKKFLELLDSLVIVYDIRDGAVVVQEPLATAKSGDYTKKLPALITFRCVPYDGLKEYVFNVRVSVITSNSQPTFSLRIINHEKQCNEMIEEFMSMITDKLSGSKIKTYIGDFDFK